MELILASRNKKKIREMETILAGYFPGIHILSLDDIGYVGDIEENGETYEENALIKARAARAACDGRYATIADDSGLSVDALDGAPGVYSARYAGTHGDDEGNNRKMLAELGALPESAKPFTARYVCAISVARGGRELACFVGTVEGQITLNPSGTGGFGYDPLFIPAGYDCTMAEITAEEKNSISHRGEALRKFEKWLNEQQELLS